MRTVYICWLWRRLTGLSVRLCFLLQLKEKVLQRQQGSYILTVEAGRQLLLSADSRAEVALQAELTDIQERWKHASICLDDQKKELATLLKVNLTHCQQFVEHREPQWTLKRCYKCFCIVGASLCALVFSKVTPVL